MQSLPILRENLTAGRTSSRALVELALTNIELPSGEGARSFIRVFAEEARGAADEQDRRRAAGAPLGPLAGIPLTIKDLFDVAGQTTLAGSRLRVGDARAPADATVVARLRAAGAVIVGSTNMNEFALGTTGTNRHWGTPANPWDRQTGRLPGGSSSGCAVAVADSMAAGAVGTDTAGSLRVPAAFCGLTCFKPTARRVPREGVFPLSHSLDSVGPIGRTVACCELLDAVLAGEVPAPSEPPPIKGLKLALLTTGVLDDLDDTVAARLEDATRRLSAAGVRLTDLPLPPLEELPELSRHGGLSLAEAYRVHAEPLERLGDRFDPMVAARLRRAAAIDEPAYRKLLAARREMIEAVSPLTASFDAVLMPSCPVVAPPIRSVGDPDRWMALNARLVASSIVANFLDRCALCLPIGEPGGPPVGLTLMGEHGGDARLLALGSALQALLVPAADPSAQASA